MCQLFDLLGNALDAVPERLAGDTGQTHPYRGRMADDYLKKFALVATTRYRRRIGR